MIEFYLNNQLIQTDLPPGTTVLDFVRYHQHLVGTKIGCREGDCGACTILVGMLKEGTVQYRSMTSCIMPLSNAGGKHIVTVEGINLEVLTPIQEAIVEEGGTQCGFCTVGFVVSLTGYAIECQEYKIDKAIASIDGNICRCTGYKSLERAAANNQKKLEQKEPKNPAQWLVNNHFLPEYFLGIPEKLKELSKQNGSSNGLDGKGTVVGGGTDLFVQKPEEMVHSDIRPLFDQPKLSEIFEKNGNCYIGASVTAQELADSPLMQSLFPNLQSHMKLVSSTPIRNMGTIAGNFVNASPIGDLTIFFLALDSQIVLNQKGKKRILPLKSFYKGYKQLDKAPDEIVEAISFKIPATEDYYNFEKVCKRTHLDIASVNAACYLKLRENKIEEVHISAGGVGPIPMYLSKGRETLIGEDINPEVVRKAARVIQAEIAPISDARGSAEYKRLLLRQLFYAHFISFFPDKINLKDLID